MNFWQSIPKEKLQKMMLVSIIALAVLGGVVQFYVLPALGKLNQAQAQLGALRTQISAAESHACNAAQNGPSRERTLAFAETQLATMVSGDPFAWAIREISLVAERYPVHILSWHPGMQGWHSQKPAYATFTMRLDFAGRYDEIGQFITALENRFPAAEIHSVRVSAGAPGSGVHSATLELSLLVRPEDKLEKPKPEKPPKDKREKHA